MRFPMILTLLLVASGCAAALPEPNASPAMTAAMDGITLATDRQSYSVGDEVQLILRNEADHDIGHNLCTDSVLERRDGAQWTRESLEPRDACTALLALLPAGGTASHTFLLPPRLPAGEYRFRTMLEHQGSGERRAHLSSVFQVAR